MVTVRQFKISSRVCSRFTPHIRPFTPHIGPYRSDRFGSSISAQVCLLSLRMGMAKGMSCSANHLGWSSPSGWLVEKKDIAKNTAPGHGMECGAAQFDHDTWTHMNSHPRRLRYSLWDSADFLRLILVSYKVGPS